MIVRWPMASSLPLGASSGPTKMITSGIAMTVATSHSTRKRRQWFGSSRATPGAAAGSDDIDEAVHVAERLHRAAVAIEEAGAAGHEALPAVAPLLARAEAEGDREMFARRRFARTGFAEVLAFDGD